jgi:hypothetical protein
MSRQHLVEVGQEARRVGEVLRLAVAMVQAREDPQYFQVALHADEVGVVAEPGEVRHREARHARGGVVAA